MSLFRRSALEKMSSPERLDEAMTAASPRYWIAFLGTFIIVAGAVAWGFLGSVPTRLNAQGILLNYGGEIFSATSEGDGQLAGILVANGQRVNRGDPLAVLDLKLDESRLARERDKLVKLEERRTAYILQREKDIGRREALKELRAESLRQRIDNSEHRGEVLSARLSDLKELHQKGHVNRQVILAAENEWLQAQETASALRSEVVNLDVEVQTRWEYWGDRIRQVDTEIFAHRKAMEDLEEKIAMSRHLRAPVDGHVTEIAASLGDRITTGMPVVRIMTDSDELDALLFVPPELGKRIRTGFAVNVEPSVTKKEEFGTVRGVVRSVSELPLSTSAIHSLLHNDKLVETFTARGAPVMVRADLVEDDGTASGLAWTSGKGPDFGIENGTLVSATVTTKRQAPVTLILPFLKSVLGIAQ